MQTYRLMNVTFSLVLTCLLCSNVCHGEVKGTDTYRRIVLAAAAAKEKALDSKQPEAWRIVMELFKTAEAVTATPEASYEIGFAAAELELLDLAVEAYERALEAGLSGTAKNRASTFIETQRSLLGHVDILGPEGARVFVRGVERARLPLRQPLLLIPGHAKLVVVKSSTGDLMVREVDVAQGTLQTVDLFTESPPSQSQLSRESPRAHEPEESTTRHVLPSKWVAEKPLPPHPREYGAPVKPSSLRPVGWSLVAAGTTASVLSLLYARFSNGKIKESEQALAHACAVPGRGSDYCAHALPGLQQDAQSSSNAIATWRAVRTTSWVTFGTGLAAITTGTVLLVLGGTKSERAGFADLSVGTEGVFGSYHCTF